MFLQVTIRTAWNIPTPFLPPLHPLTLQSPTILISIFLLEESIPAKITTSTHLLTLMDLIILVAFTVELLVGPPVEHHPDLVRWWVVRRMVVEVEVEV